jgi:hypothetical protein
LKKGVPEKRVSPRLYGGQKHKPWKRRGVLLDDVGVWLGHRLRLNLKSTLSLRFIQW